MKKIIHCCLYIIIPVTSILAQSNYKEGYIITTDKDTVNGLLDFRTDYTNSFVCKFKENEKATEKIYYPNDIDGFRFLNEGKYYVSRTVEIDSLQKTVFLEFLVQGLLNLYYFPEGNGYYFFESQNGEMISITKKPEGIIDNSRITTDNKYKGIISYVFRDDLPLATQTSHIGFDRRSLIRYTNEYHNDMCESGEKCIIFENDYKKKFTKFDFSAYSGFEFNNVEIKNVNLSKMLSFSPVIGAGLNICSPRLIKSVSMKFDASLSKIAGACDYSDGLSYFQYSFSGMKSNYFIGLEYIYHKGKIRPAFSTGFTYCYLFDLNFMFKQNYQISGNNIYFNNTSPGIKTELGMDYQVKSNRYIILRFTYLLNKNYSYMNDTYQLKLGYKL